MKFSAVRGLSCCLFMIYSPTHTSLAKSGDFVVSGLRSKLSEQDIALRSKSLKFNFPGDGTEMALTAAA